MESGSLMRYGAAEPHPLFVVIEGRLAEWELDGLKPVLHSSVWHVRHVGRTSARPRRLYATAIAG